MTRLSPIVSLVLLTGCSTVPLEPMTPTTAHPIPSLLGSPHTVRQGETLWRIAHSYGLRLDALAAANRLSSAAPLQVGQRLFVPLPKESSRFVWPILGTASLAGGARGIDIVAPQGSLVRASRAGRVAVATRHLSGLGRTVVVDHLDGYLTVYAGLDQILVSPNTSLRQGMPLGSVGATPLHFEIRRGVKPAHALSLLPSE